MRKNAIYVKKMQYIVRKNTIPVKNSHKKTADCAQNAIPVKENKAARSYMSQYQFPPTNLGLYNLLVTKINMTQDTYVQCKRTFTGITAVDST
jgi:cytidylate kinase